MFKFLSNDYGIDLSGMIIITCILLVRVVGSEMSVPEPDFTIGLRPDSEFWESNFIERLEKISKSSSAGH